MTQEDRSGRRTSRRSLLAGLAGVALLPAAAGGHGGRDTIGTAEAPTALGTFEDGLDDWTGAGTEALSRVDRSDWPPAVTLGDRALHVDAADAQTPGVRRPLDGVDLAAEPYLLADATPGVVEGADAPVAFEFRLLGALDGDPIAASDPVPVRQAAPGRIYWDASGVAATTLARARAIEIAWRPDDPTAADRPYRGEVVLDNVRATADRTAFEQVRFRVAVRQLEAEHGSYCRTEVDSRSHEGENGRLVFAGGDAVPYRADRTADGGCVVALDGATYTFGGDRA